MGDRLTFLSDMKLGVLLISFPPPLQPRPIIPETTSTLNISSSVDHDGPYFSRYFKTNDMQEKITPVLNPESKKQKLSAGTELRSLSKSDQSQTYALKVSTILAGPHKDSFFGGFVRFSEHSNHHSDDDNSSTTTATVVTPLIIRYECKVGTYEQFKVAPPVPIALTLDSFMWAYCENGLKHVQEIGKFVMRKVQFEEAMEITEQRGNQSQYIQLLTEVKSALECWENRSLTNREVDDNGEEVEETSYRPIWITNRYEEGSFLPPLRQDGIEFSTENQDEIEDEIYSIFSIMYEQAVSMLETVKEMLEATNDSDINNAEIESPVPIRVHDDPAKVAAEDENSDAADVDDGNDDGNNNNNNNNSRFGDIIVCESEARTEVVVGRVRQLHAPYIRFRILLCEGMFHGEGDGFYGKEESAWVTMRPLWCSLGDYDNVLGFRHILNRGGPGSWAGRYGEAFNLTLGISEDAKNTIKDSSNSNKLCKISWDSSYGETDKVIGVTRPQTAFEFYSKEKYTSKKVELGDDLNSFSFSHAFDEKIKAGLEDDWSKLSKQQQSKWTQLAGKTEVKFAADKLALREEFGEDVLDLKIHTEEWPDSLNDAMDFNLMFLQRDSKRKTNHGLSIALLMIRGVF